MNPINLSINENGTNVAEVLNVPDNHLESINTHMEEAVEALLKMEEPSSFDALKEVNKRFSVEQLVAIVTHVVSEEAGREHARRNNPLIKMMEDLANNVTNGRESIAEDPNTTESNPQE